MSYQQRETSTAAGAPRELYRFQQARRAWNYTSADEGLLFEGVYYQPVTISRGELKADGETSSYQVEIELQGDLSILPYLMRGEIVSPMSLQLLRLHAGEPESEARTIFRGEVAMAAHAGRMATLTCSSSAGKLGRALPRQGMQRICNHVLYDSYCGVDLEPWGVATTVQSIAARQVQLDPDPLAAQPIGWFTHGFLQVQGTGYRAYVERDEGAGLLTLLTRVPDLEPGREVIVYAGCDRRMETCRDKFANINRFWGFPWIPVDNPFRRGFV